MWNTIYNSTYSIKYYRLFPINTRISLNTIYNSIPIIFPIIFPINFIIYGHEISLSWNPPYSRIPKAELKHGRVAILATVGWIATDLGRSPGAAEPADGFMDKDPIV